MLKGTFIAIMHAIEMGEISWTDQQILMQRKLMHTHAAAFPPQQPCAPTSKNPRGVETDLNDCLANKDISNGLDYNLWTDWNACDRVWCAAGAVEASQWIHWE